MWNASGWVYSTPKRANTGTRRRPNQLELGGLVAAAARYTSGPYFYYMRSM